MSVPEFTVAAPHVERPADPRPLKLADANYKTCGKRYCVSPSDLKKQLRNKAEIGRYIGESKAQVDYYKSVTQD